MPLPERLCKWGANACTQQQQQNQSQGQGNCGGNRQAERRADKHGGRRPRAGTVRQTGRHYPVSLLRITFTDVDGNGAGVGEGDGHGVGFGDGVMQTVTVSMTTMCVICAPFWRAATRKKQQQQQEAWIKKKSKQSFKRVEYVKNWARNAASRWKSSFCDNNLYGNQ